MTTRFSRPVQEILQKSGWFTGRHKPVAPSLSGVFDAARVVLEEFDGLHFGECDEGVECARSDVEIDPRLTKYLDDELRAIEKAIGTQLFALGEVHRGHLYLVIDEQGKTYLLSDEFQPLAPSFTEAIEKLLLGLGA